MVAHHMAVAAPGQPAPAEPALGWSGTLRPIAALGDADLAALVETLDEGLVLLDPEGWLLLANAAARRALGFAAGPAGAGPVALAAAGAAAALAPLLDETALDPRGAPRRATVPLGNGSLRVTAFRLGDERVAMLLRPRPLAAAELSRVLAARFGLEGSYARLAARVYAGWSNREIAAAFHLPLGRVKWRLWRVFRLMGVASRAALAVAVDAELERAPAPGGPAAPAAAPAPALDRATLAHLRRFLTWAGTAWAAWDSSSNTVYANPEGERALKRAEQPTTTPWPVRPGLVGLRLERACLSPDEVEALLVARHGLSPHQARIAALIGRGWANAAVAAAVGVRAGTVRALSATVYAKLGVHTRLDLAGLLAELGAPAGAPGRSAGVGGPHTRPFQPAAHPVAL